MNPDTKESPASFTPKAFWDFHQKATFSFEKKIMQQDLEIVCLSQIFSMDLRKLQNRNAIIFIHSGPVECSDQNYLQDFSNFMNYSKLGKSMELEIDTDGQFIGVKDPSLIIEEFKSQIEPLNPPFWKHYYDKTIKPDPHNLMKDIFTSNYAPVFMFMNKDYELPYSFSETKVISFEDHPIKTDISVAETIHMQSEKYALHTKVESKTSSFELEGARNMHFRSEPMQSISDSMRTYSMQGELERIEITSTQSLNPSTILHKEKTVLGQPARELTTETKYTRISDH